MVVGYVANTPGEVVEGRTFTDCDLAVIVNADNVTVKNNRFVRAKSDGQNGASVIVTYGVKRARIIDNVIDGSESVAHASAIFMYVGAQECIIKGNVIIDHPQVGIAIGSTTYFDHLPLLAPGKLAGQPWPWSYAHLIEGNTITGCGRGGKTGDAGSGIAIVGASHRMIARGNVIRYCGGHGIVYAGACKGSGAPGTPALDESPTWGMIVDNICEYNGGQGIRNSGANYTWIKNNFIYSNAGGTVVVVPIGGTSDARGVEQAGNRAA